MSPAARVLVAASLAVAAVLGLVALIDATRYRGEIDDAAGRTTVVFEVHAENHGDPAAAAAALWLTCASAHGPTATEGPVAVGEGTYRAALQPSLGEEARRRLRGCLQDLVVERAIGEVESMVNEPDLLLAGDGAGDDASRVAGAPASGAGPGTGAAAGPGSAPATRTPPVP